MIAAVADMKPLLKSRGAASKELSAQTDQSEDEASIPSPRTSTEKSKNLTRLEKLEKSRGKLRGQIPPNGWSSELSGNGIF